MPLRLTDKLCATCRTRMMQVPGTRKYCDACQEAARIRYCAACGIVPVHDRRRLCDGCRYEYVPHEYATAARNREIRDRRATGESLMSLADAYGITKQRVSQIARGLNDD